MALRGVENDPEPASAPGPAAPDSEVFQTVDANVYRHGVDCDTLRARNTHALNLRVHPPCNE